MAIQTPSLLSEGGNITLALPANFTANVAWFDASGNPLGAPEPLVTMTQLAALEASMTAAIVAVQTQLTAQITQVGYYITIVVCNGSQSRSPLRCWRTPTRSPLRSPR